MFMPKIRPYSLEFGREAVRLLRSSGALGSAAGVRAGVLAAVAQELGARHSSSEGFDYIGSSSTASAATVRSHALAGRVREQHSSDLRPPPRDASRGHSVWPPAT